jgi:Carboxypeptidase regulatory-like domain
MVVFMKKVVFLILSAFLYTSCTDESDAPKGLLNGKIVNVTQTPVRGATIDIYQEGANTPIQTITTDNTGQFSSDLAHGTYRIQTHVDGYEAHAQTVSVNDNPTPLSISLQGPAVISGRIINSQTGTGLAGATLRFFRTGSSSGRVADSPVLYPDLTTVSDQAGLFEINDAPTGWFMAMIEKDGFFVREMDKVSLAEGLNEVRDLTLVDIPESGAIRIVLLWGETPNDLDSHLTGPDGANRFHMYWDNKTPTGYVSLDLDDQEQYGPETTTITNPVPGLYRYSVHNYLHGWYEPEGAAQIAASPTVVEVYNATGMLHSFTAPAVSGNATTWRVFELNVTSNVTLTPVNAYVDNQVSDEDIENFRNTTDKKGKYNINDF